MTTRVIAPMASVPPHSLVRSAVTNRDTETDWQRGLTYAPESTGGYRALSGCSANSIDHTRDAAALIDYMPWELQVEDPCHTTFGYSRQEVTDRLARAIATVESFAIARELWEGELVKADVAEVPDGDMAGNLYLAKGPTVRAGGAVSAKVAVGWLEQAVGEALFGQQAFIHISRDALPTVAELIKVGNLLYTRVDNVVVADAGYRGTPPDGTAPAAGVSWAYATGPVVVRRSQTFNDGREAETTDPTTNTITRRASKVVAATFDSTALFAVPITLA